MDDTSPVNAVRRHDRSLDTHSLKVDRPIDLEDRGDATKARAETARHVVFQGHLARYAINRDEFRKGSQHGGWSAAEDLRRPIASLQSACEQFGHEAVVTGGPVVGRQFDLEPSLTKIVDGRQERSSSHSVEQG